MSNPEFNILTSPEGKRILNYVTQGFYHNSYIGLSLFQAIGLELDDMRHWVDDVRLQLFPQTATWSIEYWENTFGIETNENLSLEYRRQRILTKLMERPPMNPAQVEKIVSRATDAIVKVIENVAPYTFKLIVEPVDDVPINLVDGLKSLKRVKPSHLAIDGIEIPVDFNTNIYTSGYIETANEYKIEFSCHDPFIESNKKIYISNITTYTNEYNIV